MEMIRQYFRDVSEATDRVDRQAIECAIETLKEAYRVGRMVFLIGNGGSAAAASHFAEDLAKGALRDDEPKRFRVLSLTDNTPFITAVANDIGYEDIFAFQLRQYAQEGDVLIAISGSGNSRNIIKAAAYAKEHRMKLIAFTGFDGGKLAPMADCNIHVPIMHMCKTEAVHGVIMHLIADVLLEQLPSVSKP